jgi:hypothetical protein
MAYRSSFHLVSDETLNIQVSATESFNSRLPEIFDALVECTAFVNQRYVEMESRQCSR